MSLYKPRLCLRHVDPLRQLGNYFGALTNWAKLQSAAAPGDGLIFSVVGWYALTLPQDPEFLSDVRTTIMAPVLASGMGAQRPIIFHQDKVTTQFDLIVGSPTDAPNRSRIMQSLISELYNTDRKANAGDGMEGTLHCTYIYHD